MKDRSLRMDDLLDLVHRLNYTKSNLMTDWADDLVEDSELRDINLLNSVLFKETFLSLFKDTL